MATAGCSVLSVNLLHGGGSRLDSMLEGAAELDPDVVVLLEFRASTERRLAVQPESAAWSAPINSKPTGHTDSIGIIARKGLEVEHVETPAGINPHRLLAIDLPTRSLRVVAIYGPLQSEDGPGYWRTLAAWLGPQRKHEVMLIGDFNTGEAQVDSPDRAFWCSNEFVALRDSGYGDLWRSAHGADASAEWSWCSRRGGEDFRRFRLDHALATDSVHRRLISCDYRPEFRTKGRSDHKALFVRVSGSPAT